MYDVAIIVGQNLNLYMARPFDIRADEKRKYPKIDLEYSYRNYVKAIFGFPSAL
jgi:hypothetical protein